MGTSFYLSGVFLHRSLVHGGFGGLISSPVFFLSEFFPSEYFSIKVFFIGVWSMEGLAGSSVRLFFYQSFFHLSLFHQSFFHRSLVHGGFGGLICSPVGSLLIPSLLTGRSGKGTKSQLFHFSTISILTISNLTMEILTILNLAI